MDVVLLQPEQAQYAVRTENRQKIMKSRYHRQRHRFYAEKMRDISSAQ